MNKIDQLANEKFNGDIHATIKYIHENFTAEQVNEYFNDDITLAQAGAELAYIQNGMGKEAFAKAIKDGAREGYDLTSMGLTEDEVKSMDENPFKVKLKRILIVMLIANVVLFGGIFIVSRVWPDAETVMNVLGVTDGIGNTIFAGEIVGNAMHAYTFKKYKKKYKLEDERNRFESSEERSIAEKEEM